MLQPRLRVYPIRLNSLSTYEYFIGNVSSEEDLDNIPDAVIMRPQQAIAEYYTYKKRIPTFTLAILRHLMEVDLACADYKSVVQSISQFLLTLKQEIEAGEPGATIKLEISPNIESLPIRSNTLGAYFR